MMGLPDSEIISMICSSVLISNARVTDRQTELPWHRRAIAYVLSRVKTEKMMYKVVECLRGCVCLVQMMVK